MYGSYHHLLVANKLNSTQNEIYDVVGPICESGDVLARDRRLPQIEEGDLLAILNAGAYGFAMSSQYNSRPKAAEVLIKDKKCLLVRKRETFDSLLSNQQIEE
jgi:diaminopimelate decarboxylase